MGAEFAIKGQQMAVVDVHIHPTDEKQLSHALQDDFHAVLEIHVRWCAMAGTSCRDTIKGDVRDPDHRNLSKVLLGNKVHSFSHIN